MAFEDLFLGEIDPFVNVATGFPPETPLDLNELIRQADLGLFNAPLSDQEMAIKALRSGLDERGFGVPFSLGVRGIDEAPLPLHFFSPADQFAPLGTESALRSLGLFAPSPSPQLSLESPAPSGLARLLKSLGQFARGAAEGGGSFVSISPPHAERVAAVPIPEGSPVFPMAVPSGAPAFRPQQAAEPVPFSPVLPSPPIPSIREERGLARLLPEQILPDTRARLLRELFGGGVNA